MRIVRYELEIVDYQQLQPLWPGNILSVAMTPRKDADGRELPLDVPPTIDVWAFDNTDNQPEDTPAPVLGVWIIGTGDPIPQALFDADAIFRGTCVMINGRVWHVFTAVIGVEYDPRTEGIQASGPADYVEQMAARHRQQRGI